MRNLPNIEKSAFRPGVYVGYTTWRGASLVYHISRAPWRRHEWRGYAQAPAPAGAPQLIQRTLSAMSDSLNDLAATPTEG